MSCHMGGFFGAGGGFMGLGSLLPLFFLGTLGYLLYKFFSKSNTRRVVTEPLHSVGISDTRGSSMDILNKKFASGEISEAEYLRKKDLLRQ